MFHRILLRICALLLLLLAPLGVFAAGFISIDSLTPGRWSWGGSQQAEGSTVLHMQSETIKTIVQDHVAKTLITHVFKNDTDRDLAGTYLFPLPKDAAFSSFSLHIDGKMVEGEILEAAEARKEYEQIVRRRVDPGLLEYADYKTVRARIFPIPAHGTKKVEFEYTQLLKAENGLVKYHFPLKGQDSNLSPEDVSISVRVASSQGVRTVWSPTHKIETMREDDHNASISFSGKNLVPDKDFLLYYSLSDNSLTADLLTEKQKDGDGYFLLALTPPLVSEAVAAKDVLMVIDTSGSMAGEKIKQARAALKYIVEGLSEADRFNIILFNTDTESFKNTLVPATKENRKAALAAVNRFEASGGTNLGAALTVSAEMLGNASERPAYLILVSDGEPTVGEVDQKKLVEMIGPKGGIRVFDFGVGYDVNTRLMDRIAASHHGTSQYVEPEESLETALSSFYSKIKNPVLTDVKITYEGVLVRQVYPATVKDLFAGSQTLLLGKYENPGAAKLVLSGKVNGNQKAYTYPLSFPSIEMQNSYLPRLWAMRRIGYLTEIIENSGEQKEVVDEIVSLSKRYGIISPYTAFLSVADSERKLIPSLSDASGSSGGRIILNSYSGGQGSGTANSLSLSGGSTNSGFLRAYGSGGSGSFGGGGGGSIAGTGGSVYVAASGNLTIGGDLSTSGGGSGGTGYTMTGRGESMSDTSATIASAGAQGGNVSLLAGRYGSGGLSVTGGGTMTGVIPDVHLLSSLDLAQTGEAAVKMSKLLTAYKQSDSIGDVQFAANKDFRTVEDKTFHLKNGYWTDDSYDAVKSPRSEEVRFGSSRYFELAASDAKLAKYLAVGQQVIVVHKGHCYKIEVP